MSQEGKKQGPRDKYILIFDDGVEQLSDVSVSPNTEWYSQSDFKKKKLVSCIRLIEHSAYLELEKERDELRQANDNCISLLLHESRMQNLEKELREMRLLEDTRWRPALEKSRKERDELHRKYYSSMEIADKFAFERDKWKEWAMKFKDTLIYFSECPCVRGEFTILAEFEKAYQQLVQK